MESLSSRRAWIEMQEGEFVGLEASGRSPHGERGLKLITQMNRIPIRNVALLTESVD